jgi:acid phosphatase (class A)
LIAMVGAAKDHYRRPRPFVTEAGPTCVDVSPEFAASGSYPSGHSAAAWLYALLLAEIDPGNAAAIVARGRAFGESRVVCGVHYETDVEGGRLTTTALVAALHGDAEFEADMAAARWKTAKARTTAAKPDHASCPADAALATPW